MLPTAETLRDVMASIMRVFKKPPPCIVYDNACNLMRYCHSREWNYWKDTTFYVDSFHMTGHTACSIAHSITNSKQSAAIKFLYMNTSVAESGNAGLTKLKTSIRRAKADSAFICILIQLELQNADRIRKLLGRANWNSQSEKALSRIESHHRIAIAEEDLLVESSETDNSEELTGSSCSEKVCLTARSLLNQMTWC